MPPVHSSAFLTGLLQILVNGALHIEISLFILNSITELVRTFFNYVLLQQLFPATVCMTNPKYCAGELKYPFCSDQLFVSFS